jgi:hypothetical protein
MSEMAIVSTNLRPIVGEIKREANLQPIIGEIRWIRSCLVKLQLMVAEIDWVENRSRNVCDCGMVGRWTMSEGAIGEMVCR